MNQLRDFDWIFIFVLMICMVLTGVCIWHMKQLQSEVSDLKENVTITVPEDISEDVPVPIPDEEVKPEPEPEEEMPPGEDENKPDRRIPRPGPRRG